MASIARSASLGRTSIDSTQPRVCDGREQAPAITSYTIDDDVDSNLAAGDCSNPNGAVNTTGSEKAMGNLGTEVFPDSTQPATSPRRSRAPTITIDTGSEKAVGNLGTEAFTDSTQPRTSSRRLRAPTITIDTSAIGAETNQVTNGSSRFADGRNAVSSEGSHAETMQRLKVGEGQALETTINDGNPKIEMLYTNSTARLPFDDRDSRPTSPHNVSSPTSRWDGPARNFLSVPASRLGQTDFGSDSHERSTADSPVETAGPESRRASSDEPPAYLPQQGSESPSPRRPKVVDDNGNSAVYVENASDGDTSFNEAPEALRPDSWDAKDDFGVENNPFAFSPGQLNKLLNPKSMRAFYALGGIKGLEKGLRSDRIAGLSVDEGCLEGTVSFSDATCVTSTLDVKQDGTILKQLPHSTTCEGASATTSEESFSDRRRIFKDNRLPKRKSTSLSRLIWTNIGWSDIFLLSVLTISLGIGLQYGFENEQQIDPKSGRLSWQEIVLIIILRGLHIIAGAVWDRTNERLSKRLVSKVCCRLPHALSIWD